MIDYWKIGIAGLLLFGAFATGWALRNRDFNDYKKEINHAVQQQEAKVESIQKQHELVKKGIQDEYDAKLNLLRNYYANGVQQPSSGKLPNLSSSTSIPDVISTYNVLAGQCSETTLMLVELQKFINEAYGIK